MKLPVFRVYYLGLFSRTYACMHTTWKSTSQFHSHRASSINQSLNAAFGLVPRIKSIVFCIFAGDQLFLVSFTCPVTLYSKFLVRGQQFLKNALFYINVNTLLFKKWFDRRDKKSDVLVSNWSTDHFSIWLNCLHKIAHFKGPDINLLVTIATLSMIGLSQKRTLTVCLKSESTNCRSKCWKTSLIGCLLFTKRC